MYNLIVDLSDVDSHSALGTVQQNLDYIVSYLRKRPGTAFFLAFFTLKINFSKFFNLYTLCKIMNV